MIKSTLNTLILALLSYVGCNLYLTIYYNSTIGINQIASNYEQYVVIFYILAISFISHYLYNKSMQSASNKKLSISLTFFKYIAEIVRFSSVYVAINSILIDNFTGFEFHDNIFFVYIGISISAIAIALFISAKISLGKNYSHCYDQKKPSNVVNTGLYNIVRHPIYSSNILLIISVLIISGSYLIFINLLLVVLFYTISAYREERYLISRFPEYRNYSKKTGMFIPRYRK